MAVLATAAFVTAALGVIGFALAGYFALRASIPDYQAALIVSAVFVLLAAICAVAISARVRRRPGQHPTQRADAATGGRPAQPAAGDGDPVVRLIVEMVQSPAILSALALGIAAGRATKRSRRD